MAHILTLMKVVYLEQYESFVKYSLIIFKLWLKLLSISFLLIVENTSLISLSVDLLFSFKSKFLTCLQNLVFSKWNINSIGHISGVYGGTYITFAFNLLKNSTVCIDLWIFQLSRKIIVWSRLNFRSSWIHIRSFFINEINISELFLFVKLALNHSPVDVIAAMTDLDPENIIFLEFVVFPLAVHE